MRTKKQKIQGTIAITIFGLLSACAAPSKSPNVVTNANDDISAAATKAEKVIATEGTVIDQAGKDRLICRKIKPTGTRFAETWCLTQSEWSGLTRTGKRTTDELQSGGLVGQPGGGN